MSGYLIGNLLGRLVVSYVLVWVVMFLGVSKLNWRTAFTSTHRWYGIVAVVLVFGLGVTGGLNN